LYTFRASRSGYDEKAFIDRQGVYEWSKEGYQLPGVPLAQVARGSGSGGGCGSRSDEEGLSASCITAAGLADIEDLGQLVAH